MTKNEIALIVGFLNELDDEFSNAGCNDMYLQDTPENRKIFLEAEKLFVEDECDGDGDVASLENAIQVPYGSKSKEKKIGTNNQTILGYLRKKLMNEFNLNEEDIPNTASW